MKYYVLELDGVGKFYCKYGQCCCCDKRELLYDNTDGVYNNWCEHYPTRETKCKHFKLDKQLEVVEYEN